MTDYYRNVTLPALREAKLQAAPRQLRQGLADDGRWLDDDKRAQAAGLGSRSVRASRTLVEYRARLAQVLDDRSHDARPRSPALQAWCARGRGQRHPALQAYLAAPEGLRAGTGAGLIVPPLMQHASAEEARAVTRGLFPVWVFCERRAFVAAARGAFARTLPRPRLHR